MQISPDDLGFSSIAERRPAVARRYSKTTFDLINLGTYAWYGLMTSRGNDGEEQRRGGRGRRQKRLNVQQMTRLCHLGSNPHNHRPPHIDETK